MVRITLFHEMMLFDQSHDTGQHLWTKQVLIFHGKWKLDCGATQVSREEPNWLQSWVPTDWFKRYERRIEESRLSFPKGEHEAFLEQIGQDGSQLLSMHNPRRGPFSALPLAPGANLATHLGSALRLGRRGFALAKQR